MIRVVVRASRLAAIQVREVFEALPGTRYSVEMIETFGDQHKELSLLEPQRSDFFTDTIDRTLLDGRGDVAVHSAKDLPWPLAAGLDVVALTASLDPADALVSADRAVLRDLAPGSHIGTSSPLRKANLLAIRPDLAIVGIRGTIEERLALVDRGEIDALVVAVCALKRLGLGERIAEILPFPAHPLQGMLAVVARSDKPTLRAHFSPLDHRAAYGKVWIVGAGPGDPSLLTKKAAEALNAADCVFYDDLIDTSILNLGNAERHYVGKRKSRHYTEQESINELLYQTALQGKRVVRLKGGDPFIFGRGGEEVRYLRERYIPVEVIPGITAVQSAAAETLVPLTQRGVAGGLSLVSGHGALESGMLGSTVGVYMGASSKSAVAARLRSMGFGEETGVALVLNASSAGAQPSVTSIGRLADNPAGSPLIMLAGPAVDGCRLPRRILYTGLDPFSCLLDGTVVHYPLIRTERISDRTCSLEDYDGIVFTSRNAVRYFFDHHDAGRLELFAIGKATAREIARYNRAATAVAEVPDSRSLRCLLEERAHGKRLLYPCSQLSRNVLHDDPQIHPLPIYRTLSIDRPAVDLNLFQAIVFSSPSTVDSFSAIYRELPGHCAVYVYGAATALRAASRGISQDVIIKLPPGGDNG